MINLIKDIKENCQDHSIEGIVDFLLNRGDLSIFSNYHREIYFFYKELRKSGSNHKEARSITMEGFKLSPSTFKRVIKKYKSPEF